MIHLGESEGTGGVGNFHEDFVSVGCLEVTSSLCGGVNRSETSEKGPEFL